MPDAPSNKKATAPTEDEEQDKHSPSECEAVKLWNSRIAADKKHWDKDFKRMKRNMAFACGYQRSGQKNMHSGKYMANITIRVLLEKMASLYARNPKAEWKRRERLDYQIWDGKMETLQQAAMATQQAAIMGMPPQMQNIALLMDVVNGRKQQDLAERIGKTIQNIYSYQILEQEPDFKDSMKDLVLRAEVCGVGYVRISFERDFTSTMASHDVHSLMGDRMNRLKHIMQQLEDTDDTDPRNEEVVQLIQSLAQSMAGGESQDMHERIVFDFPEATSIIPDCRCRNLKTFDGARWITQEYIRPLDEVNEFFETDIPMGAELKHYDESGKELVSSDSDKKDPSRTPNVCLREVFDMRTKGTFFLVDGYKYWVQEPQAVTPMTRRFWPVYGLVFNKVIVEPGIEATCYPPSDVDLMRSPQEEWNRSREELRTHRKINRPWFAAKADKLTKEDKEAIRDHEGGDVIEVQGMQSGEKINDIIQQVQSPPIQPQLYDTTPIEHDILMAVGSQQANIGPVARTTATESSIAEQSKMSSTASNVDELDELLSGLAKSAGEIIMREFSEETMRKIVGPGGVLPPMELLEDFINEVYLDSKAASSGRPNKALEISNAQIIMPLLQQAGANPVGLVEELVRRLDDQIDVSRFFPLVPPAPAQPPGKPSGPPSKSNKQNGPQSAARPPMRGRSAPPQQQHTLPSPTRP